LCELRISGLFGEIIKRRDVPGFEITLCLIDNVVDSYPPASILWASSW